MTIKKYKIIMTKKKNNFINYNKTSKNNQNPNQNKSEINTEFQGECLSDFRCVTEEEVRSIIISSPPKSCCLDPIPTPLLMKHLDSTVGTITSIINESLSSGSVPDSFKHAVVRPLLKKQNMPPNELENYRPVSNLPFLSKILEKVVLSQLKGHLLK